MRQKRRRIPKEVALEDQLSQMTKVEEIDTPIEEATDGEMGTNKLVIGLSNKNVDYRHAFTTEEIFPTREKADKTDNFIWALEKLRGLTLRNDVMPKIRSCILGTTPSIGLKMLMEG
ncbi:hypothetical protein RJT34_19919 [Clitoria ternatea]|uniref:Uncharacterized protein n=1 Tax=Clitoria ternatea TaxID=43366 RepID=A0AAN9ISC9_CLITE